MKYLAVFLFVGLAVASPLQTVDDALLQDVSPRFLASKETVTDKDDTYEYVDHVDIVRSLGFCLRNFDVTGINDAADCLSQNWRENKASSLLLKSFLKKSLGAVGKDINIEVSGSEQATVYPIDKTGTVKWAGKGTVSINGASVSYDKLGLLRIQKEGIIFEEVANVSAGKVDAGAAVYIQVDVNTKTDQGATQVRTFTTVNQGAGFVATGADGTVTEVDHQAQATVNTVTVAVKKGNVVNVGTQADITSAQRTGVHIHSSGGSTKHYHDAKSDGADVREGLNITLSASGAEVSFAAIVGVVGAHFSNKPDYRYGVNAALIKSATVSVSKGKVSVSNKESASADALAVDFQDNVLAKVQAVSQANGQVSVTYGADKGLPLAAQGQIKGSASVSIIPQGSGKPVVVTEQGSASVNVKAQRNSDGNVGVDVDYTLKASIHIP